MPEVNYKLLHYNYPQIYFLGIDPVQKAKFLEEQQKAQETRNQMPLILQFLYPVEGKNIGTKTINTIQEKINVNPVHNHLSQTLSKDQEIVFLKQLSEIQKFSIAPQIDVRRCVAEVAGNISDPGLAVSLIERLCKDPDECVRQGAAQSAGNISNPELAVSLIERLCKDPDINVRRGAAEAVGKISDPKLRDDLIENLCRDPDCHTRRYAAASAGNISDPELAVSLIERLCKDPDINVRRGAAKSAGNISDPKLAVNLIERLCYSSDCYIRRNAAQSAGNISDPKLRDGLIESLCKDSDCNIREGVAESVGKISDPKLAVSLIKRLCKDPDCDVRLNAAKSAGSISDPKLAVSLIESLCTDPDRLVKRGVAQSAGNISDPELRDSLIEKLSQSRDGSVRRGAAEAVGKISDPKLRDGLIESLCKDSDCNIREGAAKSAWNISDPNLRDGLIEKLSKDPDYCVKQRATQSAMKVSVSQINEFTKNNSLYFQTLENSTKKNINSLTLSKLMHILCMTGNDCGVLNKAFSDYDKFVNHALTYRDNFGSNGNKIQEEELKSCLNQNTSKILSGIVLFGNDLMMAKFDQKQIKFDNYLEMIDKISNTDDKLCTKLYKVCRLPKNEQGDKLRNHQKLQFVESAYNYINNSHEDILTQYLEKMEEKGIVSPQELVKGYLKPFAEICGMSKEEIEQISPDKIDLLDMDHVHTIPIGIDKLEIDDSEKLKGLFKSTLQGNYWKYIQDISTPTGQANQRTKQAFKDNNLNYDKWLNYDKPYNFEHNGKEYEVNLWKRNPGHDLFLGNYGNGCISLDGINAKGIVDALMNTLTQFAEVKDKSSDKTVAYARCFWGEEQNTDEKKLIIDNIHYKYDDEDSNGSDLIKPVNEFMKSYGKEVAGMPVKTYLGRCCHLTPENNYDSNLFLKVIGSTEDDQYYLNSLNDLYWSDIDSIVKAKVYELK